MKKPVKLLLTREDDVAAVYPRPMTHHVLKAGLDHNNNLLAWYHRLVAEICIQIAAPPSFEASGGDDLIGWRGLDQACYDIPHALAEAVRTNNGMRVCRQWRGIGAGYNKFAAEAFLDEVAQARRKRPAGAPARTDEDPPRAHAVIKAAAEMSDFANKRPDRGMGIAFSDYHERLYRPVWLRSPWIGQTGKINVHNYWIAVDPGLVLQPNHVQAQLEGAVVMGIKRCAAGRTVVQGRRCASQQFQRLPGIADERHSAHP